MEPEGKGKRLQDRELGTARPGTQERLIQLIGDPVLAPAVPKRLWEPREVERRLEGNESGTLVIPIYGHTLPL